HPSHPKMALRARITDGDLDSWLSTPRNWLRNRRTELHVCQRLGSNSRVNFEFSKFKMGNLWIGSTELPNQCKKNLDSQRGWDFNKSTGAVIPCRRGEIRQLAG